MPSTRFFNTDGPVRPDEHYAISPLARARNNKRQRALARAGDGVALLAPWSMPALLTMVRQRSEGDTLPGEPERHRTAPNPT